MPPWSAFITNPLPQEVRDARLIERFQLVNSRLRQLNRTYARRGGMSYESVVDEFKAFIKDESFNNFAFQPKLYPKHKSQTTGSVFDKDHSEIAGLVLSDWQIGETVDPKESNGINKFNSRIASNRVYTIIDKFKRIVRGH